jgi:hypothetical protein
VSGEERAEVRRRRHSSHQDGGEREGEDRKRRSLLGVFDQLTARCRVPGAAEEDVGNGVPDGEGGGRAVGTVGVGCCRLSGLGEPVKHLPRAGSAEQQSSAGDLLVVLVGGESVEEGGQTRGGLTLSKRAGGGVTRQRVAGGMTSGDVLVHPLHMCRSPAELVDDGGGETRGSGHGPVEDGCEPRTAGAVGGGSVGEVPLGPGTTVLTLLIPVLQTQPASPGGGQVECGGGGWRERAGDEGV